MKKTTPQLQEWCSAFGKEYTERNFITSSETVDQTFRKLYGVTRSALNEKFLGKLDRSIKILEVGCNVGGTLLGLKKMGFKNLHGIEPQDYPLEAARRNTGAEIVNASAFDIPFATGFFDMVYTCGVLIHISPETLPAALDEIFRCSREWIWGFEYFAPESTAVVYRGKENLLWKSDFAQAYLRRFPDLELVKEERVQYLENSNVDSMFLLRKARPIG